MKVDVDKSRVVLRVNEDFSAHHDSVKVPVTEVHANSWIDRHTNTKGLSCLGMDLPLVETILMLWPWSTPRFNLSVYVDSRFMLVIWEF